MRARRPDPNPIARAAPLALAVAMAALVSCSPEAESPITRAFDLRPPELLEAGPLGARSFVARFDEAIVLVDGSLAVSPGDGPVTGNAVGRDLAVEFADDQSPGLDYRLTGEVEDSRGNRTCFLLRFVGWNDRVPALRFSEVQTGKNNSQSRPHRDYLELEALEDGNIGGVELSWSSSVKTVSYRFPGAEVRKGDFIVLHLAPEGNSDEADELGDDLSASGGVDATAYGRDFWSGAGPLPDENGAICLKNRPGGAIAEGFFYANDAKSGELGEDKLSALVASIAAAGAWPITGQIPSWEDALSWRPSPARSICRHAAAAGAESWYVSAAGGQSPGSANPPPES